MLSIFRSMSSILATMINCLPKSVKNLIEELSRLPGIGPKSAQRLTIHLLRSPDMRIKSFGEAVLKLKENVKLCQVCCNIAEDSPCSICDDSGRDKSVVCVVEEILDVVALEKSTEYKGVYHVLHGVLSPIDAIGPEELKLEALFERVKAGLNGDGERVKEIILATNPSLEGEATALYIQKHLKDFDGRMTRIARGLPVGSDLEYADEVTLSKAMAGRSDF